LIAIAVAAMSCMRGPAARCPAPASEPVLPAEDAALKRWQAIVADRARVPAGASAIALVPELEAYLGSPDPVRRDGIGYEVLSTWINDGTLADTDVRALADRLLRKLAAAVDPAPRDGVFGRSFAALVLASIVRRDVMKPFLGDDERRAILTTARDYAEREVDLRGHTGATGWAHAAAHTADLLAQLAKEPAFSDGDRALVLDAVAAFVVRPHGTVLAYGEDGRLGVAVIAAAKRGLPEGKLAAWLAAVKAPVVERWGPQFDAAKFAAQRNARNLLFTVYVQASLIAQPGDGERLLAEAVRSALAD
jgi:hypothetical protein